MNQSSSNSFRLTDAVQILSRKYKLLLVPAVIASVLAAGYAVMRTPKWQVRQTLMVRNEALNEQEGIGRFRDVEQMKVTQETIMEIAKSNGVLREALKSVDSNQEEPSLDAIAALRDAINLTPPKGAEFGKTEIFYLQVKDKDRDRAVALAAAVSRQLQLGLARLRDARAQSMISELSHSLLLAEADLNLAKDRLVKLESQVGGGDMAELIMQATSPSGDSDLRRRLNSIEDNLRTTRLATRTNQELLRLLQAARKDPATLLATPNRLLESQPGLRRLKDGLVDAQIQAAELQGRKTQFHPDVVAAQEALGEIRSRLHDELSVAIRGVGVDLQLAASREALLKEERDNIVGRLDKIAALRADYSTLAAEVKHRTTITEAARSNLAVARASQASAHGGSLITVVDTPTPGLNPEGPGKSTIVLCGMMAGMFIGLGLVFLTTDRVDAARRVDVPARRPGSVQLQPHVRQPARRASAKDVPASVVSVPLYPSIDVVAGASH